MEMEMENDYEKSQVAGVIPGIASPVPNSTFQFTDGMQIEVKMTLVACWEVEARWRITIITERPENWAWQIPVLIAK